MTTRIVVGGVISCVIVSVIVSSAIFVYNQYSDQDIEKVTNNVMGLFASKTETSQTQHIDILNNSELLETIKELKKENAALKEYNEQLHQKIVDIDKKVNNRTIENSEARPRLSEISKARLEAHIEKMLKDKSINIKYLPDFVEEAIYRNIFGMLLNLLDYTLETANIELLGHQLQLDLKAPSEDEESIVPLGEEHRQSE